MISQTTLTPRYLFPLLADGRYITEFEVGLKNGEWVVGGVGGHKVEFLQRVAQANNLDVSECRLVKFDPKTAVFAVVDGKEIGLAYRKSAEEPVMSEEDLAAFKETVGEFFDQAQVRSDVPDDEVIFYAKNIQNNEDEYSFRQNDSLYGRLCRYLDYCWGRR